VEFRFVCVEGAVSLRRKRKKKKVVECQKKKRDKIKKEGAKAIEKTFFIFLLS
jgi:hypothetical protein